jgi:hypothetical protein
MTATAKGSQVLPDLPSPAKNVAGTEVWDIRTKISESQSGWNFPLIKPPYGAFFR